MHTEKRSTGLPPVTDENARVLILGSFPGPESLRRREYYGHPQNHFWKIMFGMMAGRLEYGEKVDMLKENRIALWDVIKSCRRKGSSDCRIKDPELNDISAFLRRHPGIRKVFLNGGRSARLFRKIDPGIEHERMPSTSPRNARYAFYDKMKVWSALLEYV